ncbi:MAG: polymerase [Glaciihabitans sp.]|nr:polymerase [Glaciihabitans sp.]
MAASWLTLPPAPSGRPPMTHPPSLGVPAPAPPFDLVTAYDEHGPALFGFAVNTLRDRSLAEDCVQEVFLRAWRSRDQYSPEKASLRTWLFAIARNVIIDVQRSLHRMPRLVPPEDLEETPTETADPLDRLTVVEGLAKLTSEHREVVVDIHLNGLSYAEVAEKSGVPVATLRSRSFYALRALRTHLTEMRGTND